MPTLSQIVSVNIVADSRSVAREGFGIPAVLTYHTRFLDQYRVYSSTSEMLADGFTTYDDAYRKAAAILSQEPCPESVVVGRLPAAPAYTKTLTVTASTSAGAIVSGKVKVPGTGAEETFSYTVTGVEVGGTTGIATAVELLVEALTGVNAAAALAVITCTPAVAGTNLHFYDLVGLSQEETTAAAGYDTELALLKVANPDWFFVVIDSNSEANQDAVATWCLANDKMCFFDTQSGGELAGTGTLTGAQLTNDNAVYLYSKNSHECNEAGWCGLGAAQDPGFITWAYKEIAGSTNGNISSTQEDNLEDANINHHQTVAGRFPTLPGKVASGEFIDVIHGIYALKADIAESVFQCLMSLPKVAFTQKHFDVLENVIMGALRRFEGTDDRPGLIAPGTSEVIMPSPSAVSTANRQARRLPDIRFSGTLAGAVHYVEIDGTLTA